MQPYPLQQPLNYPEGSYAGGAPSEDPHHSTSKELRLRMAGKGSLRA